MAGVLIGVLIIVFFVIWLIIYYFTSKIMEKKGYSEGAMSASLCLGIMALVYATGLPDLEARRRQDQILDELQKLNDNKQTVHSEDDSKNYTATVIL